MPRLGVLRHRARWAWWVARTRLRLRRHGIRLELEVAAPPTWDAPPRIELTRQPFLEPPRGPGPPRLALRLGNAVHLGRGLVLELRREGDNEVVLGTGTWLTGLVRIALFDGRVELGPGARLRGATLRCSGHLRLGERAGVHEHSLVHCARRVDIGAGTLVTERCSVLDSEHRHDGGEEWFMYQGLEVRDTALGDNVLVGAGSTVLAGARVGASSVVAAGSVVRAGEYPPSSVLAGTPAQVVRSL